MNFADQLRNISINNKNFMEVKIINDIKEKCTEFAKQGKVQIDVFSLLTPNIIKILKNEGFIFGCIKVHEMEIEGENQGNIIGYRLRW